MWSVAFAQAAGGRTRLGHVIQEGAGVVRGKVPDRASFLSRCEFEFVLALVHVRGEVADVGDVDDVGHLVPLPLQHAAQRVGEDVGAQIADVLVGVHGGTTRIDVRRSGFEGYELLEFAPERVEQSQRQAGHPD
jgi:hypothetical protein